MRIRNLILPLALLSSCLGCNVDLEHSAVLDDASKNGFKVPAVELASDLARPVRLEAEGAPIDIASLGRAGHASPWIADVDCDGKDDLLVGDFPGYFWFFKNKSTTETPKYAAAKKLQAGGVDAKVPVY